MLGQALGTEPIPWHGKCTEHEELEKSVVSGGVQGSLTTCRRSAMSSNPELLVDVRAAGPACDQLSLSLP